MLMYHISAYNKQMLDTFWSKIDIRNENECWPWTGYANISKGVIFAFYHNKVGAARLMYEITYGEFDESLFILHKCDNPLCMNPTHLRLGTCSDNHYDMNNKFRHPRQRIHPSERRLIISRLNNGESVFSIASEYDVSEKCIRNIRSRYEIN